MKRFLLLALLFIGFGGSIEAFSENKHSALFRNLDRDQDGLIARKEWIGNESYLKRIDGNGDSRLTYEEFSDPSKAIVVREWIQSVS